jgi:hypothetical protein
VKAQKHRAAEHVSLRPAIQPDGATLHAQAPGTVFRSAR